MAMRQDNEVKPREIDSRRPHVVGEVIAVSSRVEQNPLAAVLDQGRVAPAPFQSRRLSKRIVQDGYASRRFLSGRAEKRRVLNRALPWRAAQRER